jgi:hypothetical protein
MMLGGRGGVWVQPSQLQKKGKRKQDQKRQGGSTRWGGEVVYNRIPEPKRSNTRPNPKKNRKGKRTAKTQSSRRLHGKENMVTIFKISYIGWGKRDRIPRFEIVRIF